MKIKRRQLIFFGWLACLLIVIAVAFLAPSHCVLRGPGRVCIIFTLPHHQSMDGVDFSSLLWLVFETSKNGLIFEARLKVPGNLLHRNSRAW